MKNKNYLAIIILFSVVLSSCNFKMEEHYYHGSETMYREYMLIGSSGIIKNYYLNGNLQESMELKKTDDKLFVPHGHWKKFYPDGFPKESYICDSGMEITPMTTGILNGYEVLIDIEKERRYAISDTLNFSYHNMRAFIDGIPLIHYWIYLLDRDGKAVGLGKSNKIYTTYAVSRTYTFPEIDNEPSDTFHVEIDESMYQYIITDSNDDNCLIDSAGIKGYKFGIYFADTTRYIDSIPKQVVFVPFEESDIY